MSKLLILIGFSGAGKDTVAAELTKYGYTTAIPHTTRPMREGESQGSPYNFVDYSIYANMEHNGEFIETNSYPTLVANKPATWHYGTAYTSIRDTTKKYVLTTGIQSAMKTKEQLQDDAIIVFLHAPDEIREERAKQRGSFDQTEWDRRLKRDIEFRTTVDLSETVDLLINNTGPIKQVTEAILSQIKGE